MLLSGARPERSTRPLLGRYGEPPANQPRLGMRSADEDLGQLPWRDHVMIGRPEPAVRSAARPWQACSSSAGVAGDLMSRARLMMVMGIAASCWLYGVSWAGTGGVLGRSGRKESGNYLRRTILQNRMA